MTENPCFGCEDRYPGCHCDCGAFFIWRQVHEAERKEISEKIRRDSNPRSWKQHLRVKGDNKWGGL